MTNATVGVGLLHFALRWADKVHWQAVGADKAAHSALTGEQPAVAWSPARQARPQPPAPRQRSSQWNDWPTTAS
ncbi:hypothetical protein [Streptomyces globisporus]|uniref:hypothetical protein n=1 Tax=Streptomyces globisporus TaxID=1908 RepID=UPI00368B0A8F